MNIDFAQNLDCKEKGRKHLPSSYLYSFSILATSRLVNYLRLKSQACMTANGRLRFHGPARNLPRYSQACPVPAGTG